MTLGNLSTVPLRKLPIKSPQPRQLGIQQQIKPIQVLRKAQEHVERTVHYGSLAATLQTAISRAIFFQHFQVVLRGKGAGSSHEGKQLASLVARNAQVIVCHVCETQYVPCPSSLVASLSAHTFLRRGGLGEVELQKQTSDTFEHVRQHEPFSASTQRPEQALKASSYSQLTKTSPVIFILEKEVESYSPLETQGAHAGTRTEVQVKSTQFNIL